MKKLFSLLMLMSLFQITFAQLPTCTPTPGNCICYGDFEMFSTESELDNGVAGSPTIYWISPTFSPTLKIFGSNPNHPSQHVSLTSCGSSNPLSGGICDAAFVLPLSCSFNPCDVANLSFSATTFPDFGGGNYPYLKFRFIKLNPILETSSDLNTISYVTNPSDYLDVTVSLAGSFPIWDNFSETFTNTTANTYDYVLIWASITPSVSLDFEIGIDDIVLDITGSFDESDLPQPILDEICEDAGCTEILTSVTGEYTVTGPGVPASPMLDIFGNEHWQFCPSTAGIGVHTITVCENSTGCCTDVEIEVLEGPTPNVGTGTFTGCIGEPLLICPHIGIGDYTYLWNTGQTTQCITVVPTSILGASNLVTVTSASGCTASAEVSFFGIALPNLFVGPDQFICSGETATLIASSTSSGTIEWYDSGNNLIGTGSSVDVTPNGSGSTHVYTASVTDPVTLCKKTMTVSVHIHITPKVTNTLNETICISDDPITIAHISNCVIGNTMDNYFSPVGTGGSFTSTTGLIVPCIMDMSSYLVEFDPAVAGVGSHTIEYVYTDPLTGCTNSATGTINVLPSPDILPIADFTVCQGETINLTASVTPGSTTIWVVTTLTNSFSVIGETLTYTANSSGTNVITITSTNVFGCSDEEIIIVTVIPTIKVLLEEVPVLCVTDSPVNLSFLPAGGTWTAPPFLGFTGIFSPSVYGVGTHSVTYCVPNSGGCPPSCKTIMIQVDDIPDATFTPIGPFCITDPDVVFNPATPGGSWSGSVEETGSFDPSDYGVGTHEVTYTVSSSGTSGTNLVCNGDMEDYNTCITDLSQIGNLDCWSNAINGATPDYFNSCQSVFPNFDMRVPVNTLGTQADHSGGNGYFGIHTYLSPYDAPPYPMGPPPPDPALDFPYREFVKQQLADPMEAGKIYRISFYVSMADKAHISTYIGMYISNSPAVGPFYTLTPQIESSTRITNQTGWTEVSGDYTAVGGEQYITIGNFRQSTPLTNNMPISGYPLVPWPSAIFEDEIPDAPEMWSGYYYVDDVSIEEYEGCSNTHTELITVTSGPCALVIATECYMPALNPGVGHLDETVAASLTWTGEEHWIGGDFIIPDGVTLDLSGTILNFGKDAKMIIEPGGKVIVRDRCILRACSSNHSWQGIEVQGKKTKSHTSNFQGTLIVKNSTIMDAETAIYVGKKNTNGNNIPTSSGGIIRISQASLLTNNGRNIFISEYTKPNNQTEIRNSVFNLAVLTFPFTSRTVHLDIEKTSSFTIEDNSFVRGEIGIRLENHEETVISSNRFDYVKTGIELNRCSEMTVRDNSFVKSETAIYTFKSEDMTFKGNSFVNGLIGIEAFKNRDFIIDENTFTDIDYPVITEETKPAIVKSSISDNVFENPVRAIQFLNDDHTQLKINCNQFLQFTEYAIKSENTTLTNLGSPNEGAGNSFSPASSLSNSFLSHTGTPFNYYYGPSQAPIFGGSGLMSVVTLQAINDRNCREVRMMEQIPEENESSGILVYPNPNDGNFSIQMNDDSTEILGVEIYDYTGKLIQQVESNSSGNIKVSANLPAGIYLIKVQSTSGTRISMVVVE